MVIQGRYHNSEDIKATVLAVEPVKYVHRGRIVVFSVTVLREERMVIVAEQKANCSEDESFQWMSHVLPAVDTVHSVGVYCLCLVPPNGLPKSSGGRICTEETRIRFLEGSLHPVNVLMCPHTTVTNLPKPRQRYQGRLFFLFKTNFTFVYSIFFRIVHYDCLQFRTRSFCSIGGRSIKGSAYG